MAGANDFTVQVAMCDSDHLRDFALDACMGRPEVAHIEASLIFEFRHSPVMPIHVEQRED
ncbi:MAG: hypothetical protein ACK5PG_12040 [Lysobacterales bacterium]